MSGLGAALARGLAGYAQGRAVADERDYRRAQDAAAAERQAAKDKEDAEYRRLMMAQMTQQMQRQTAQDGIAAEGRTNEAVARGFRPVGDQWDTFNDMVGIDPSKAETISVNGQPMRKVAPTQQFQDGMRQKREQDASLLQAAESQRAQFEALRQQLPASIRPLATDLKSAQALAAKVAEQRMAPPRQESPVNMQVIQTADGPMAFNPRTGRAEPITAGGKPVQAQPNGKAMGLTGEPAKRAEAMSAVEKELTAYRAMLDTQGPSLLNLRNEDKTKLESQYGNLQMALKEAYNLGVLNGPDLALIEKQITPPVGIAAVAKGKPALLGQVDQVGASMKRRQQAQGEVYGTKQAAPSVNTDAIRSQAVQSIQRGADPAAVRKRYEELTGQRWEE